MSGWGYGVVRRIVPGFGKRGVWGLHLDGVGILEYRGGKEEKIWMGMSKYLQYQELR